MNWFLDPIIHHYADFKGRATRQQYWMFVLMYVILSLAISVLMIVDTFSDALAFLGPVVTLLFIVFLVGTFIPALSLLVRRLHDIGWSGWWCLLNFIPYIGGLIVLILCCIPSQKGTNKYGPNPHGDESATVSEEPTATPIQATPVASVTQAAE